MLVLVVGCNTLDSNTGQTKPIVQQKAPRPLPSAAPLQSVSEKDVLFAQTALKQLGYKPGIIDGMWGSQSASAMRAFEKKEKIKSANGKLSALNLYALSKNAKVLRSVIENRTKSEPQQEPQQKPTTLTSKLAASESSSSAPQLIILDAPYPLLAKANPYSEVVSTLQSGTSIYVLDQQGEWFEVESEEQERGFIKENP